METGCKDKRGNGHGSEEQSEKFPTETEYEEVEVAQVASGRGGGTLYRALGDKHLYRFNKKREQTILVNCYHARFSKVGTRVVKKCKGHGELHAESKTLKLKVGHNHKPDLALQKKLKIRKKVRYACNACDKKYMIKLSLDNHVAREHDCPLCQEILPDRDELYKKRTSRKNDFQ